MSKDKIDSVLFSLFTDVKKSPVAFKPARLVYNYLKNNLNIRGVSFSYVSNFEREHVRENQINRRVPSRKFPRLKYFAYGGLDDVWQIDLVDLHANRRNPAVHAFLLTKIDVFSRQGDAELVRDKSGFKVTRAFDAICRRAKIHPRHVHTDEGKEFFNSHFEKYCKDNRIHHYKVNSEVKAALVERFNRTVQSNYYKYKNALPKEKPVDLFSLVIRNYNHTPHSSLEEALAPADVDIDVGAQLLTLRSRNRNRSRFSKSDKKNKKFKFDLNDKVRILVEKGPFSKSYRGTYSEEVFVVSDRFRRLHNPNIDLYRLKDLTGERIEGIFYEADLQKVGLNVRVVEKVLKRDRRGKKKLVKFKDYPKDHSEWIKD